MKGIVLIALILSFLVVCGPQASAFWGWNKKNAEQPSEVKIEGPPEVEVKEMVPRVTEIEKPVEQKKQPEKEIQRLPASIEIKRALVKEKRRQLNNTEWEVELVLLDVKKRKQTDIITFKNNQIVSANFLQRGFSSTNYTLTVQKNGRVIWETMQTSRKTGIAFWRGEIDVNMEKMQGILSHHIDGKKAQDYSFMSVSKKVILPSQD